MYKSLQYVDNDDEFSFDKRSDFNGQNCISEKILQSKSRRDCQYLRFSFMYTTSDVNFPYVDIFDESDIYSQEHNSANSLI